MSYRVITIVWMQCKGNMRYIWCLSSSGDHIMTDTQALILNEKSSGEELGCPDACSRTFSLVTLIQSSRNSRCTFLENIMQDSRGDLLTGSMSGPHNVDQRTSKCISVAYLSPVKVYLGIYTIVGNVHFL